MTAVAPRSGLELRMGMGFALTRCTSPPPPPPHVLETETPCWSGLEVRRLREISQGGRRRRSLPHTANGSGLGKVCQAPNQAKLSVYLPTPNFRLSRRRRIRFHFFRRVVCRRSRVFENTGAPLSVFSPPRSSRPLFNEFPDEARDTSRARVSLGERIKTRKKIGDVYGSLHMQ